jgi:glycosyltransferase involved in cell wall biosynthesis
MSEFSSLVSIVIPVYNGADYLREAIDSALAQTYNNVEVIVVNDGSCDGGATETVARSYGNRIRYFCKENGGTASALNLGIREMRGEWFAWLSHDDRFSPDRVEEDVRVIREHPNAKIVFCGVAIINSAGEFVKNAVYPIYHVSNPHDVMQLSGVHMCTMTVHKSCFEKVGMFNESNVTAHDTEMSLLLSKYFGYYFNNKSITYVREHATRGTHRLKAQHKKDRLMVAELIQKNFTISDFYPDSHAYDDLQLFNAWIWMGNLYCSFGAFQYAADCYKKAHGIYKYRCNTTTIRNILYTYKKRAKCIHSLISEKRSNLHARWSAGLKKRRKRE